MKKFLIIGVIVSLAMIVVGGAGLVYAKAQDIANPASVTITTTQNGDQIIRQFGPEVQKQGNGIVIKPGGGTGDDGIFVGPGGMMGEYGYQTNPGGQPGGYGPGGMMGGMGPGGMMGGAGPNGMMGRGGMMLKQKMGFMREYMISAFANAVGLTVDEVNTRLANGETPREIALAQGKTEADLPALWKQVRQDALNAAVAAGAITQAQADLMLQHMNNYSGEGFGPGFGTGNCPMMGGDETPQP